jgi:copper chaperone for superoxide dismutase
MASLLRREYAVQMTCDGCASAVRGAVKPLAGVESVAVFPDRGTFLVTGDVAVDAVLAAVEATGRAVRLVGSGSASEAPLLSVPPLVGLPDESTAAVAEFKGTAYAHGPVYGVMRLVQLTGAPPAPTRGGEPELTLVPVTAPATESAARAEVSLSGLPPGTAMCVAVHTSGDVTDGAASTGPPFDYRAAAGSGEAGADTTGHAGCVLSFTTDASGNAAASAVATGLRVWAVLGRAAVLHAGTGAPDTHGSTRLAAAVLARSAAVGSNDKRVCACDGAVLWDLSLGARTACRPPQSTRLMMAS